MITGPEGVKIAADKMRELCSDDPSLIEGCDDEELSVLWMLRQFVGYDEAQRADLLAKAPVVYAQLVVLERAAQEAAR